MVELVQYSSGNTTYNDKIQELGDVMVVQDLHQECGRFFRQPTGVYSNVRYTTKQIASKSST